MNYSILKEYGIDYEAGLTRCLNDADFYKEILLLFVEDTSFTRSEEAYVSRNLKELFSCMHELKGVCGNAGLAELYEAVTPLVDRLRSGDDSLKDIGHLFENVRVAYIRTREGIITALND